MRSLVEDFSVSAAVAAMLALIVSCAGPVVIILQAASLAGLSEELTTSWIWAIFVGSGVTGFMLSLWLKAPIVTASSAPGAALLLTTLPMISFEEAIGAYIVSAVIIIAIGVTGSLDIVMKRIPPAVSAGMFAGILFDFGVNVFASIPAEPFLVLAMLSVFIVSRRLFPRYAIMPVMAVGAVISYLSGEIALGSLSLSLARPVFTMPTWSWTAVIGVSIPLTLVTLTGQYISGMAILHTSGYPVRSNGIMSVTGIFSLLLAPFGAHAINLAALTAAICTGPDAHEDPAKRYVAGVLLGCFNTITGLFGITLVALFSLLPATYTAVLAGLALIGAFTSAIQVMVNDAENLESGMVAFLAAASGMVFLGLGAPFWGVALGGITCLILKRK